MPRFSREQVRKRQRIAVGILAVITLIALGGCTALLIGVFRGERNPATLSGSFEADDSMMSTARTPADAAALEQLPEGIELADDEVMGIDVSSHQRDIDWQQVAGDGYVFAYIKATEGTGFTDSRFEQNWEDAREAGLTVGAYHYFTLCSPGAAQARDFLATVAPDDSALPPVLDLEFDGACDERPEADHAQEEIDDFTAIVEEEWGRRLVIYSSSEWRDHYGLPVSDSRPDWLYSDEGRPEQQDWSLWQVRFDGAVSGIEGDVDIDVARIEVLREHAAIAEGEGPLTHAAAAGRQPARSPAAKA